MSVRIPTRLNRALDWASRNRILLAIGVTVVSWTAAVAVQSLAAGAAVMVFTVGLSVLAVYTARTRRLREDLAQARYDNSALQAELADRRTGSPSDPTVRLRAIGEGGERT